jgi:signal transduction histidine kinase
LVSQRFSFTNAFCRYLAILLISALLASTGQAAPVPRSVLILNESSAGTRGYEDSTAAIRSTLNAQTPSRFAIYIENLDLNQFLDSRYKGTLLTYLRDKYIEAPIGAIAANGTEALKLALQLRGDDRWSRIPIVFSSVDEQRARALMPLSNATGRFVQLSLNSSIDAARMLVRDLRQVVLVGDALERQPFRGHFAGEMAEQAKKLEVTNLLGVSLTEIKNRVANLPASSVILYTTLTSDEAGHRYLSNDALEVVAKAANRPIVVDVDNRLGHGATGGFVIVPSLIGEEAGQLLLRLFNGEDASAIPVANSNAVRPVFDWRELQRWGINEKDLPQGSEIRFRPLSAWEQYRSQILLLCAVILTQTALITALLYERRRRRTAEQQSFQRMTELAHLNRIATVGELSASIAHEVKQPLTAIVAQSSAALRWLGHNSPNLNEARGALQKIKIASDRASQIVDNLRSMFRKEGGTRTPLNVNTMIANVVELTRDEAYRHGISVRTSFDRQNPVTVGDRAQLEQVFLNLMMNAIEAMSSSKADTRVLELKTAPKNGNEILVTVADTGPGIATENLGKIFDEFYTTKPHGMGMGLSICRSIIESHGGRLWASPGDNGLVFYVSLPMSSR